MGKISIIVPVYNGAKTLRHCIESILAQDYKDFEAIIVDDGSKDDSFKIISEYADKDDRIIAIHKQNSGVSATRNVALGKATGQYVQFMDVDDWLPFDSMKLMVRSIQDNDADLVVADFYRVVDDKISRKGSIRKGGVISRNEYADKMLLTPADFYYGVLWNKLYKKQIIDEFDLRMDESISMSEDSIFNLQYLLHIEKVSILKAPVYYYVKSDGSLVAKNLNVHSIFKFKSTVIRYFNDFYRQIMDEDEYEARKPIIYGYLVAISTDALSVPLLDETKKLKDMPEISDRLNFELAFERLSGYVFDRLLKSLAEQHDLEIDDIRILYYLHKGRPSLSVEEIVSLTGTSLASVSIALARLMASSYVKIADFKPLEEGKICYEYRPSSLDEGLDKVEEDFRSIVYDGLSIDDVAAYARISKQIYENMKKTIDNE